MLPLFAFYLLAIPDGSFSVGLFIRYPLLLYIDTIAICHPVFRSSHSCLSVQLLVLNEYHSRRLASITFIITTFFSRAKAGCKPYAC